MKKKTGIVVVIAAGVAALLAFMGTAAADEGEEEEGGEEPDPNKEPAVDPAAEEEKEEEKTPARRRKRVPAMGQSPYNTVLFPSEGAVRGVLAGLGSPYVVGATGSKAAFARALKKFQGDWNFLAAGELLRPNKLNRSNLTTDGIAGYNTLRALEWAREMKWIQLLIEAGLV